MEEFHHLLQQAAKLKTEQLAVDRRRFDTYPEWYQHSMFAGAETRLERERACATDRLAAAMAHKEDGNRMLAAGDFNGAFISYGNALGLFRWLENSDPNWKKKAINDADISEHCWTAGTLAECDAADTITLGCYLNLGLLYQKHGRWADAVRACDAAIALRPQCAKGYYRKAQALAMPLSAGTTDYLLALEALKRAAELEPDDAQIRNEYNRLRNDVKVQIEKDKARFRGFLQSVRPATHSADTVKSEWYTGPSMSVTEAYEKLQDMESAAARHYASGLYSESAELMATVEKLRGEVDHYVASQRRRKGSAEQKFDEEDPEYEKAIQVATNFVSDLRISEIKSMLRGRGIETSTLIPPPKRGAGQTVNSSFSFAFYYSLLSYLARTRFYFMEVVFDCLQEVSCQHVRLISAHEEDCLKGYLIRLFASDMYDLKMKESGKDLLPQLMDRYKYKIKGMNYLSGGLLSLSTGSWCCVILFVSILITRLVKQFFPAVSTNDNI